MTDPRMRAGAAAATALVLLLVAIVLWRAATAGHTHRTGLSVLSADGGATTPWLDMPSSDPSAAMPSTDTPTPTPTPTPDSASPTSQPAPPSQDSGVSVDPAHNPTPTGAAPATCVGVPPPNHIVSAACDVGKHTGIPTDCMPFHTCIWPDSWGTTPGGPYDLVAREGAGNTIDVTWTIPAKDLAGNRYAGPVHSFVVRLYHGTTTQRLRQYQIGVDARSYTIRDVAPGTYTVEVLEVNDSGIDGAVYTVTVAAAGTPTPTVQPS